MSLPPSVSHVAQRSRRQRWAFYWILIGKSTQAPGFAPRPVPWNVCPVASTSTAIFHPPALGVPQQADTESPGCARGVGRPGVPVVQPGAARTRGRRAPRRGREGRRVRPGAQVSSRRLPEDSKWRANTLWIRGAAGAAFGEPSNSTAFSSASLFTSTPHG